jgi:hypothetical protein
MEAADLSHHSQKRLKFYPVSLHDDESIPEKNGP